MPENQPDLCWPMAAYAAWNLPVVSKKCMKAYFFPCSFCRESRNNVPILRPCRDLLVFQDPVSGPVWADVVEICSPASFAYFFPHQFSQQKTSLGEEGVLTYKIHRSGLNSQQAVGEYYSLGNIKYTSWVSVGPLLPQECLLRTGEWASAPPIHHFLESPH